MRAQSLHSCQTLTALRIVSHLAPLSTGFSRPEYWSRLPCPPPGDLPDPGIEPTSLMSPALADGFFTTWEALCACACKCAQSLESCPSLNHGGNDCCFSVTPSCPTLCDPTDFCRTGFPVLCHATEFTQTHIHRASDAIQPCHPPASPSPPAFSLSWHQGLF